MANDAVYTDIDNRILVLSDTLNNETCGILSFVILQIIAKDNNNEMTTKNYKRQPIKLYINSDGGDVNDTFGLISIIKKSKTPIYTYCTGYAYSSAFYLFIAGHERFAYDYSIFMVHQMHCSLSDKYQSIVNKRDIIDKLNEKCINHVVSHTKITKNDMEEIIKTNLDKYIYPDEAIKLGVVDKILK